MKKIKVLLILSIITCLLTACSTKKDTKLTDAEKFKKEYESINNKVNDKTKKKYREVSISKDNPFIYATAEDIIKKIDDRESFIVYFGFKECPWCRSIIEELIRAAKDQKTEKIYYVDVTGIRDVKELDTEGNIKTINEGSKAYLELIDKMSDVLDDYTLTKDEEKISVGEKRIYAPNVIAISNGKAIQLETGISEDLKDPYGKLTKEIKKYAYNKFKCLLKCLEEESITCQKNSC